MNKKIDISVLNSFIENDELCQHAIKELSIAGYFNPDKPKLFNLAKRVLNNVAIHSLQKKNKDIVDTREIELTAMLSSNEVICPLTLDFDEFYTNNIGGEFINIRQHNIIKDNKGIYDKKAYYAVFNKMYDQITEETTTIPNMTLGIPKYLIEIDERGACTGRIFTKAYIKQIYINKHSYIPKTTINIYSIAKRCANYEIIYFVVTNNNNSFDVVNDSYNLYHEYLDKIKGKNFATVSNITVNKFIKSLKIK